LVRRKRIASLQTIATRQLERYEKQILREFDPELAARFIKDQTNQRNEARDKVIESINKDETSHKFDCEKDPQTLPDMPPEFETKIKAYEQKQFN
jgi:hypothetical protein